MPSSSTTDSDITETFTNSESDDKLGTDSVCDCNNESDNENAEQHTQESFEEWRWRVKWFEPKKFTFNSSDSGLNSYLPKDDENRPLDYFLLIFDHSWMQKIVEKTKKYHSYTVQHANLPERYQETIGPERYTFFGIYMLMAHTRKSRIKEYWFTDPLISTLMFADIMSRNRFRLFLRFLYFNDNEYQSSDDRLYQIKSIVTYLCSRFGEILVPYQNLCIDESLMLWKGRLSFKQYIPSKRSRFGIKTYVICDFRTGMILDFIIYTGAITDIMRFPDPGVSGSIVMTLMQPYLDKGHNLLLDSWFTSPTLFEKLHTKSTGACGTVRANRVDLPKFEDKPRKRHQVYQSTDNMLIVKWCDKREVIVLSTTHEFHMGFTGKNDPNPQAPIQKPTSIIDYNSNRGAIDKVDMQTSFVDCIRKFVKWYKRLLFRMLDLIVLNSYLLYKMETGKRPQLVDFPLELICEILQTYHTPKITIGRPIQGWKPTRVTARHFPSLVPQTTERKNTSENLCRMCTY